MKEVLALWLILINLIAFVLFGIDKAKAKKHVWRIPEATLFLSAWLGGGFGAILGMKIFRHKTLHKQFQIGIPMILIVWICLILFLWQRGYLV